MSYAFQPNSNFHEVFAQSLAQNMLNANLTYDPASAAATMIESFSGALAATNGTSSSMLNAGASWLQKMKANGVSIAFFLEQPCHVAHALT